MQVIELFESRSPGIWGIISWPEYFYHGGLVRQRSNGSDCTGRCSFAASMAQYRAVWWGMASLLFVSTVCSINWRWSMAEVPRRIYEVENDKYQGLQGDACPTVPDRT